MPRRLLTYAVDLALLVVAIVAFATGLLVDNLDLHEFVLHRWAGYALAGLVVVHVGMHWRFFVPVGGRRRSRASVQPADVAPAAAATGASTSGPTRRAALAVLGGTVVGAAAGWAVKDELSPNPYKGGDVGLFYHRESSLGLRGLVDGLVHWGRRPTAYKQTSGVPVVALPPVLPPSISLDQALRQRRSLRTYRDRDLTVEELAWLVHAACGITDDNGHRTAPSAGALYPIETYVAVRRVHGIDPGLYHVDVRGQRLERIRAGSVAGDLMVAGLGQGFLRDAPAVLVLTGLFQRTRWKYHARHYRYVCWEGGHVAQNVYLAAEAAGLGACVVGAFLDGMVNDLLHVDGRQEAALGLIAVGPR